MASALFLSTYSGYTQKKIDDELDEAQYLALLERIAHVQDKSPIGVFVKNFRL